MDAFNDTKVNAHQKFFEALQRGGIDAIIETASHLFQSPVLFTDHNYRLISMYPQKCIGESIWDTLFESKTLPLEIIWEFQNAFLKNMVDVYNPFYANWGYVEKWPRIFGEVYSGSHIIGHVAIFLGKTPFQDGDLALTQLLIDTLNIELRSSLSEHSSWKPSPSAYLHDLLNNDTPYRAKQIAEQSLRQHVMGDYVIMATPLSANAAKKAFAAYAIAELERRYRNIISLIYNDSVITLIGEVKPSSFHPQSSSFIQQIAAFFGDHNMVSGLSDSFQGFHQISARYIQAQLTAELGIKERGTTLAIFSDYSPMQMFLALSKDGPPEAYIHPVLTMIKDYDRTNHSDFFETLRVFSLVMHNKDAAALQLSIHRNTLLYRLNRIRDIFDLSFEDERTAIHLLTSFLLLDAVK